MIEQTQAFKRMDCIQQRITVMASSRKTIRYHLELLRNVGMERWQQLNTALPERWKNIVVELDKVSQCTHPKESQVIKVVMSIANCETTVIKCSICHTYLSEPITDCP